MKSAARFQLIDFTLGWVGPSARLVLVGNCSGQWRVDVAGAADVQNAHRICSDTHGKIMRQLAFDLSTGDIDRWDLQIWCNTPGCLLSNGHTGNRRNVRDAIRHCRSICTTKGIEKREDRRN